MGQYDLFRKISQSNLTSKQRTINQIQNDIINDFKDSPSWEFVTINGTSRDVQITDNSSINKVSSRKKLLSKPGETFSIGEIVVWNSENWLITDLDNNTNIQYKGFIQLSTSTLSFYDTSSTLHFIPCIISDKITLSEDVTKFITLPDNQVYCTIPNTLITRQIKVNTIFTIGLRNYQLINLPDDITKPNLLVLKMQYSEVALASHVFTVSIQNADAILHVNDTLTLDVLAYDNGITVTSPTISYLSSNPLIATVTNNGIVACLTEGATIITAIFNNISDSLNIVVQSAVIPDNYTVLISGTSSIKVGQQSTFSVTVYNNGIATTSGSIPCIWSLTGADASITSQDSMSCVVKAGSTVGQSVTLRVSKSDNASVFVDKVINIVSLF